MKKHLLIGILVALAAVGTAGAQSFQAPVTDKKKDQAQRPPPPAPTSKVDGAFPRAARGGNPLQLLNPRAPEKYRGTPQDTVMTNDSSTDPQRGRGESGNPYTGVILFGFRW